VNAVAKRFGLERQVRPPHAFAAHDAIERRITFG
jgi:hypothetical protein